MHRHALATGDISDHGLSADGIATSRAVDQQIILALDADALPLVAAEHPAHRAADATASLSLGRGCVPAGASRPSTCRAEYLP